MRHTVASQFVRHDIPGLSITTPHKLLEVGSMVEPNRVTDDVGTKPVTLISIHQRIIDEQQLTCQYPKTAWLPR
jgi:hypothetical protein